jgi:tRNA 5-methylaminomethyl-2-thiouridine biosynthesis bifunctional protein
VDATTPVDRLASCSLPDAWADLAAWTVLDTAFADGSQFLATWRAWQMDVRRPRMLHYVGIAAAAPTINPRAATVFQQEESDLHRLSHALTEQCSDLGPGFHRIKLDSGRVSLTLCLGEVSAVLGEQVFQADTVFANAPENKWAAQLLARRCKRGTPICIATTAGDSPGFALMQAAGFQWNHHATNQQFTTGTFNPRWEIPTSRNPSNHATPTPARCAVIGAGIAGASVAQAMAVRGWQVTVFDLEATPAGGASGLPAGLVVPHVSADDNPRSRLSRSGTRLMKEHARRFLVQGQDWDPTGVMERRDTAPPLWHPQAAWIKPAPIVQAWLAQPGVRFVGQTKVHLLSHTDGLWLLHDPQGLELGRFEVVVVANAADCAALLNRLGQDNRPGSDLQDKLAALQAVHGTLSHGTYAEIIPDLPSTPVNGNGCFIPHVPTASGEQWFAGSTFEVDALAAADIWAQHAANMERLQHLLPEVGAELAETLDRGPVSLWSATRCVTHDRLPLVGPIDIASSPGLWLSVGMGSRGLSFSALCAELLVARLGAEPLPVEFSLSRSLDANRVRRKRAAGPTTHVDSQTF